MSSRVDNNAGDGEESSRELILANKTKMVVQVRADGYVNATQLAQAAGKQFGHWYELDSTQRLIQILSDDIGIPISNLVQTKRGGNVKKQGTWIHSDLATQFAQWCSPPFALQVSRWPRVPTIPNKTESKDDIKQEINDAAQNLPNIEIRYYNDNPVRIFNRNNTIWFIVTDIAYKILKLGATDQFFNSLDKNEYACITLTNVRGHEYSARAVSQAGMLKLLDERKSKAGVADVYKWIVDGMPLPEREDNLPPYIPEQEKQKVPKREDNLLCLNNISEKDEKPGPDIVTMQFKDKPIRVIIKDGKPWFVANDVCCILEYQNANKAISDNCKGYNHPLYPLKTAGGVQRMLILNEANLYRLIMRSKMPAAVEFQDWVVEEVLPTIRRTGAYITNSKATELTQAPEKGLELLAQVEQVKAEVAAPTMPAGPIINLGPFLKKSCAYLFQLIINGVKYIKPGYTSDIITRIKSLRDTFGADPLLLNIRPASAENSEKEFHKLLKARYPELYPKIKINDKIKSELYLYDQRIIDEFNMFEFDMTTPCLIQAPIAASTPINDEIRKLEAQAQLDSIALEKLKLEAPIKKIELEFEIMKWKKANNIPLV